MDIAAFFAAEVKPALGCTEPGAVALAAATAARHLPAPPERIHLRLSANIYKNGQSVGIPGAQGLRGNMLASALGALAGDADMGLQALAAVTDDDVAAARALTERGAVTQEIVQDVPTVYAEAELYRPGHLVVAVVAGRHDRVAEVRHNGQVVYRAEDTLGGDSLPPYMADLQRAAFDDLWNWADGIDADLTRDLLRGAEMNLAVAEQGLTSPWGLAVGHTLGMALRGGDRQHTGASGTNASGSCVSGDRVSDACGPDISARVKATTAAAADVRMAGANQPVMSSAGSGNHGLTAIIPPALAARAWGRSDAELARALALSHLVTGAVKARTGRLTPLCGCAVAAGAGAAAALVRLADGTPAQAEQAVALVFSSVMGMICDGAKGGCALKVGTAAAEAWSAAQLALHGPGMTGAEGIVSPDFRASLRSLGEVSSLGFAAVDVAIIRLLERGVQ
ncbi:serine dehydratase subunit alpha family protein [Nitratidesulfovibrio termitidis]|uniref:L-cysteine desulfidase family protein n=1 Tax=Nitratidesulfovibrio termitidis TaxID=42252 RepID=UPI0004188C66|nr:L-serine ammonia-lyase, iron-sulfur-dependent, subunit alpha [Nitratidesulfovibrio termitidis]